MLLMKSFPKILLVTYVLFLLWLILFKTSVNVVSVLFDYQSRSLNLIPFAGFSHGNAREMLDNLIVFVPLGLLLGINFKQTHFWRKLAFVFFFSLAAEISQFVFAIGTTDITDVIMNTLGGLLGLTLYDLCRRRINNRMLDWGIVILLAILLALFLVFRFFFLNVRY